MAEDISSDTPDKLANAAPAGDVDDSKQDSEKPDVCKAANAVAQAQEELKKAEQWYQEVRQEAVEQLQKMRSKTVGDLVDGVLTQVKKRPGLGVIVFMAVGFFFGRLFRR